MRPGLERKQSYVLVAVMKLLWLVAMGGLLVLGSFPAVARAARLSRPAQQDTVAVITSPQSLSAVQGNVSVTGSAMHPQFDRYELYYTIEPGENWVFIGDAKYAPVSNGLLTTWDTTSLPDGTYSLRLRVVRADGNYEEAFARSIAVANTTAPTPTPTATLAAEATLPPAVENAPISTPVPEATATPVIVDQPEIPTPTPRPSPTPTPEGQQVAVASGVDSSDGGAGSLLGSFEISFLRAAFVRGLTLTGSIFLAVGAFFGVRKLLTWLWYLIAP